MPLEAPRLDTRTFDELVEQARLRIPRYSNGRWSDVNDSDAGMTLVQLFAWLTEMMLFRINEVPERNYIKFLELLGMELRPAQPARAHVTFDVDPKAEVGSVRPGTQVAGQDPDVGLVVFETVEGLDPIPFELGGVLVYDGVVYRDLTESNATHETPYAPLGVVPQTGSAWYLGFGPVPEPVGGRPVVGVFPQRMQLRVFVPEDRDGGEARMSAPDPGLVGHRPPHGWIRLFTDLDQLLRDDDVVRCPPSPHWDRQRRAWLDRVSEVLDERDERAPDSSPRLVWEYRPKDEPDRWRRIEQLDDETHQLRRSGYIRLRGPRDAIATKEGLHEEPLFWIRCRLAGGTYPAGKEPLLDFVRPNTVEVVNLRTERDELVATSNGHADQQYSLRKRPVERETLQLWVEPVDGPATRWQRVDDLFEASKNDQAFELNANRGSLRFGDDIHGEIPPLGARIVARSYQWGGGQAGNLESGAIHRLLHNVTGIRGVRNERRGEGGKDEQGVDELKRRVPGRLRRRSRAVTEQDFASFALEVGGVARAHAIPLRHPGFPGVPVPGCVSVVVVPDLEAVPPRPGEGLLEAVRHKLDEHRLLTTEVWVEGPQYMEIRVIATVAAQPRAAWGDVRDAVTRTINRRLSPLPIEPYRDERGELVEGHGGRDFGQDLYLSELFQAIANARGVAAVEHIELRVDGLPHQDTQKRVVVPTNALLYGAIQHEITVTPRRDV